MASAKEMTEWFRRRFETAGASLYHDSSEGGFQFPPGQGAVDVRSELESKFPNSDPSEINSAFADLDDEGPWVDFDPIDSDPISEVQASPKPSCEACGKPARYNVLLAKSINDPHGPMKSYPRYYLPNADAREINAANPIWFCKPCMRIVEDNLRSTIMYLQGENGKLEVRTS